MRDFEEILRDAAGGVNLSPDLLWAVGQVESNHRNFDAQGRPLRSPTGPMGRWQFTEDTGRRYGAIHAGGDDRLNDEVSTPAAAHLLSDLIDKHNGDVAAALRAYNGGGDPQYVNKVFAAWRGRLGSSDQGKSTMPTAGGAADDKPDDREQRWRALDQEMPVGGAERATPEERDSRWRALDAAMPAPGAEPAKPPPPAEPEVATGGEMMLPTGEAPAARPVPRLPSTIPEMREALKPPGDGFTPGDVLPFAYRDRPDGGTDLRWDFGNTLRSLGTGALDLIEGPSTGKVTPEATMALMSLVGTRFARSPAAGTAQAIADTAELGAPRAVIAGRNRMGVDATATPPGAPAMAPGMASGTGAQPGMGAPMPGVTSAEGEGVILPGMPGTQARGGAATGPRPLAEGEAAPAGSQVIEAPDGKQYVAPAEPPPNSVGAMGTPAPLAAMRESEIQANRHQAEVSRLQERQPIGATDDRELVPGITPTMAQREQTVSAAREQKGIAIRNTTASQMEKELLEEHNAARVDYYHTIAGSPAGLESLRFARGQQAEQDLAAAFGAKRPTDATDALGAVDGILGSPRAGERDTVQSYIAPIRDKIARAMDDNGMADPERLYGIREDVAEKLGKANRAKNPDLGYVERELIQIKDALDTAIENGAGGYRQYLVHYHNSSQIIDAFDALQTAEKGLIRDGKITLSGMNRLLANVVEARKPGAPLNQWRYLPESKLNDLFNLRDDIRRATSADQLAAARGSDTAQNMVDFLKDYGTATVMRGLGSIPLVGPALRTGRELAEPALARRRDARDLQQMNKLLRPPPVNRLIGPPP